MYMGCFRGFEVFVVSVGDVDVYVVRGFFISFFSSPYTPHILGRAVDISTSTKFSSEVYSPVDGVVVKVLRVYSGLGPYSEVDYVVFIRVGDYYVKLMHLVPEVSVGDRVYVGDVLGRYLRSNYFSYHHLPHTHLEVCKVLTLRPSKSVPLKVTDEFLNFIRGKYFGKVVSNGLRLEVVEVGDGFTLCRSSDPITALVNGLPVVPQGSLGVGINYLGLIHLTSKPSIHDSVEFLGSRLGYVIRVRDWYSLLSTDKVGFRDWFMSISSVSNLMVKSLWGGVKVLVNGFEVGGVEFLVSDVGDVKLVGNYGLRPGEVVRLEVLSPT